MIAPLSGAEWEAIALSLKVTGAAVAFSIFPAFALAYLLARGRFPGKIVLDAVVHLPLVLPPVVIGWLLLIAFGRNGPLGILLHNLFGLTVIFRWTGAAIASAVMALPLMVRAIRLSLEGVDRRLEGVARTLGAGSWDAFATVTLPLSFPGIATALVLGFARALGEFGATITFVSNIPGETRTIPLAIYGALQIPGGDEEVWRLSLASILLSLVALILSEWIARHRFTGADDHVL